MKRTPSIIIVLVLLFVVACANPVAALATSSNSKFAVSDIYYYPNDQVPPDKVFITISAIGGNEIEAVVGMPYDEYINLVGSGHYEKVINDLLTIPETGVSLDVDVSHYGHTTHYSSKGTKGYEQALTQLGMM
jgi:hypothetical protein